MEDKKITRNILIISALVIALCIGIGFSFAYFTANVKGNEDAKENIVKAGKMEITYIDGSSISLDKMQPGESTTKKFKVQNTGNFPAKYNIKLDEVTNTLQDKTDLRYTLKKNGSEVKTGVVPSGSAYILTDISIDVTETPDEYELKIECVDTHTNQNDNQGKTYTGKIQIDAKEDITLATNPEVKLYQGMIPVDFDGNGNVIVADTNDKWYDYTVQKWANAVLVDASSETIKDKYFNADNTLKSGIANKIIPMDEILQMYVYIPRYKYQLFNVEGNEIEPQMINIEFENGTANTGDIECKYSNPLDSATLGQVNETCTNIKTGESAKNGEWYTHPAFTFGETELPGIWIGKFEPSGDYDSNSNLVSSLKIIPNVSSLRNLHVAYMFQGARDIEESYSSLYNINTNEIDTHMMKNIEWGAVAYLTQSKYGRYNIDGSEIKDGAEVWINNAENFITGCSGSYVSESSNTCTNELTWNHNGIHSSTTNNMSGIYDMSGGSYEYLMSNMVNIDGTFYSSNANFGESSNIIVPTPNTKYYDMYTYGTVCNDMVNGHLGDATRETRGWYNDYAYFFCSAKSWLSHGGDYRNEADAGLWYSDGGEGGPYNGTSFRVVLTAE